LYLDCFKSAQVFSLTNFSNTLIIVIIFTILLLNFINHFMKCRIIYLTGFMTSGKSTVGPILANTLGWDYYDLDREIEADTGKSVVNIFESEGEQYFRDKETEKLNELSKKENLIIALGGGTIINENNFRIIKSTGKLIYLKVAPEIIYKRIKHKLDRPLFKDLVLNEKPEEEFLKRIKDILAERNSLYESADITIDTDKQRIGLTIDSLVKKICRMINEEN